MIPLFKVFMPDNALKGAKNVLNSGQLAYGEHTREFERKIQEYVSNPNILTVSGNSIFFALKLIGVQCGDEVMVSPMSCLMTTQPIVYAGAKVIWVDIDPMTGTLDPEDIRSKVSSKTKAIIHYHWGGYPGYIDEINAIAKEYNIYVIEDASEAFGSEYKSRKLGCTGTDIVCYSFTPARLPNAIDGGGLAFNDKTLYKKALIMRDLGVERSTFRDEQGEISEKSDISITGDSATMNNFSGFVGSLQIDFLDELYNQQRENANKWREVLEGDHRVKFLKQRQEVLPSYWIFTILSNKRDDILNEFRSKGFYASKMHLRNDLYSVFQGSSRHLKGVNEFSNKQLALPCGWWINSGEIK